MPSHTHGAQPSSDTTQMSPKANYWAPNTGGNAIYSTSATGIMSVNAVGLSGNSQPHNNMQPNLPLNFCIALVGVFPSRN
jgi:microcystin-dependent protein